MDKLWPAVGDRVKTIEGDEGTVLRVLNDTFECEMDSGEVLYLSKLPPSFFFWRTVTA